MYALVARQNARASRAAKCTDPRSCWSASQSPFRQLECVAVAVSGAGVRRSRRFDSWSASQSPFRQLECVSRYFSWTNIIEIHCVFKTNSLRLDGAVQPRRAVASRQQAQGSGEHGPGEAVRESVSLLFFLFSGKRFARII